MASHRMAQHRMALPEQRTRILAGTPMDVGGQRLLPSVLVKTINTGTSKNGFGRSVKLRPISIVVTSPHNTEWLEIPNTTMNTLSTMAGAGAVIALLSLVLMAIIRLVKSL